MLNQLERRAMGFPYDPDQAHAEVERNGLAPRHLDRRNGLSQIDSDLVIKVPEDFHYLGETAEDRRDARILAIDNEIQRIEWSGPLSQQQSESLLLLETERVILLEERVIEGLLSDPEAAKILERLFVDDLLDKINEGKPVDMKLVEEARDLAREIGGQNTDLDEEHLIRLVDDMKAAIQAQRELEEALVLEPTVKAYDFLKAPLVSA